VAFRLKTKKQILKEINRIEKTGCQYIDSITKEKVFKLYPNGDKDYWRIQTLKWVLDDGKRKTKN
jgi:hypothetical protein